VPFPDPRFTNTRDGTVTDNLTELIWLRDASCNTLGPLMNGSASWQAALDAVNMLAAPACGLTDGSIPGTWRLPNVKELQSLIDFGRARPALPAGHQVFLDVKGAAYWSSTTYMITPTFAWIVDLQDGVTSRLSKRDARLFIWPVKGFPKK
jgi:hypothetical protein